MRIRIVLFAFMCTSFLIAQSGKISGVVKDKSTGESLPGVNVIVEGTSLGASTDVDGFYVILNVPVGRHEVRFTYVGYSERRVSDVIVNIDNTSTLNAELAEEVNVGDVVVVTAQRELIRRSETNSRQIKNSEEIKNMPITSVQDVVALTSGVVRTGNSNNVNVRGGRLEDTAIMIDGVNTNSVNDGQSRSRLNRNAIEEVTVQSGGFGSEFGGVMSGLIQTTTKTGSSKYNFVFEAVGDGLGTEQGDTFLGSNTNGYRNINLSVGGPIIPGTNNHFFFVSMDMLWETDSEPSWGGEAIGERYTNKYSPREALNVVLNYKANLGENMNIRLGGTGDWINRTPYSSVPATVFQQATAGHARRYFGDRAGHFQTFHEMNFTGNLTFTHTLDKNTYYNLRIGSQINDRENYDDKLGKNLAAYGDLELHRYKGDQSNLEEARKYGQIGNYGAVAQDPGTLSDPSDPGHGFTDLYGDAYQLRRVFAVNRVFNQVGKNFESNWDISVDFFKKIDKHQLKIGGGYKKHTLRQYTMNPAGLTDSETGQLGTQFADYFRTTFVNNYGYDIRGNWSDDGNYINGGTFTVPGQNAADAAREPIAAWAYISDEWVQDDFILTFGVRLDHFDPNWINLVEPLDPVKRGLDANTFDEGDWKESESFTEIQPRVGFAFPVDENTKFSANISRLVQMPNTNRIYTSLYEFFTDFQGAGNTFNNPNLKPEENTSYEISIAHQLSTDIALNVRTYYRSIKNLVQQQRVNIPTSSSANTQIDHYFTFANVDFADTKGVELSLETRRINNVRFFANYTYASAKGTGSTSNGNGRNATDDSQEYIKFATDLGHDVPHQLNVNMDYRLFEGEGPSIAGVKPFQNMGFNLIYNVQSGRPYTERVILNSFAEIDTRFAETGAAVNAARQPAISTFNLRLDKSFPLQFGESNVNLNLYVDIENLFNQENILGIQRGTGSVNEDGYLATAKSYSDNETDNEYKRESYRYLLNNPGNWGAPRLMRIGLRFEF